jgi:hypoxanthine phosphoribosyltransferase
MTEEKQWIKYFVTPQELHEDILNLAAKIPQNKYKYIFAFPRGGLIIGVYLSHYLLYDEKETKLLDNNEFLEKYQLYLQTKNQDIINDILIVDDLVDTGETLNKLSNNFDIAVVHYKPRSIVKPTYYIREIPNDMWIVYPYERIEEEPNRNI